MEDDKPINELNMLDWSQEDWDKWNQQVIEINEAAIKNIEKALIESNYELPSE